jgi:hypothetical protein
VCVCLCVCVLVHTRHCVGRTVGLSVKRDILLAKRDILWAFTGLFVLCCVVRRVWWCFIWAAGVAACVCRAHGVCGKQLRRTRSDRRGVRRGRRGCGHRKASREGCRHAQARNPDSFEQQIRHGADELRHGAHELRHGADCMVANERSANLPEMAHPGQVSCRGAERARSRVVAMASCCGHARTLFGSYALSCSHHLLRLRRRAGHHQLGQPLGCRGQGQWRRRL